ncbi:MAG: family ATPase [Deltaproteobacteria bacterium]|nr:family ATPase [Deltaproteobacteria bacterium]
MSKEYLGYWGLTKEPFHMAPDDEMMYLGGQYYECYERLLYAVNMNKGGALVVSEEAGLGKTTLLLKLITELKDDYGERLRYALVDHPTLTVSQMIASIYAGLTDTRPEDDKFRNLLVIKDTLLEIKRYGGRALIMIDEGQMLCERKDVLQELRILLNLTYSKEYLLTVILCGQRPLWNTVKGIPEFWQRLPVKYYLIPLKLEETKALIECRLSKAGLDDDRDIFTAEALEIVHRFSKGLPRTIMALSDLALLVGYTYQATKIGFKEVSKAINAMSGKGDESFPYVIEKQPEQPKSILKTIIRKIRG